MNEGFECECDNNAFWLQKDMSSARCSKCFAEYKKDNDKIIWQRKYGNKENRYENWTKYQTI